MDRTCLEALKSYICQVTNFNLAKTVSWIHLRIVFKVLRIGNHKIFDQQKRHLVYQLQTGIISDQVRLKNKESGTNIFL